MGTMRSGPQSRPPSVDQVLRSASGALAVERFGHEAAVSAVRRILAQAREAMGAQTFMIPDAAGCGGLVLRLLEQESAPSLRRVFNLTGTVLHTNLGRAVLPQCAIAAAVDAMRAPVALEFDTGAGTRGERDDHVRGLLRELTGAEDACVVNNNAAAVLLVLNALAHGKDAVVSRGELIEIGGSFRLPDIMARAGARLVEVGTTNRTHLKDYQQVVGQDTGVILKAHTSNYVIQGFTASVAPQELSAIARASGVPFVHDLGSGALVDLGRFGLPPEPTVRQALAEGADLVTFSGDKLLGGPQAGFIAGSRDLVARIAKSPMKRALRLDKIRLAALEAVLKLYRDPDRLPELLPTMRYFTRRADDIARLAGRLAEPVALAVGPEFEVAVADCASQIGSGARPLETLASAGLTIEPVERKSSGRRLEALSAALRRLPIPVVGRIRDGRIILDLRCLDDEPEFVAQLGRLECVAEAP